MIAALFLAAAAGAQAADAPIVSAIAIELSGRNATRPEAIRRLMNTGEGALLDRTRLENDLIRLRATGVLYDVSAEEQPSADGTRLIVYARDRWSLLPVFGLRRGGGRTTARVGVSERNALGRLITVYGELTSSTDVPFTQLSRLGSYVWALAPRLGGSPVSAGLYWQREFLDFSGWDPSGARSLVYDRNRHLVRAEARYELRDLLTAALTATGFRDSYALNPASPAAVEVPARGQTAALGAELHIGLLDDRVARMRGAELKLSLEGSRRGALSDFSYVAGGATLRTFLVPWEGDNFCLQVAGHVTTARDDSHLFRAGGLFEARGFPDAYFIGQRLIRANLEYRKELARYTLIVPTVMQAAVFADGGHVSGRSGAVAGLSYEGPFASSGGGLRFVLIPITRAVARVDVAAGIHPRNTIDISLGGQQFF